LKRQFELDDEYLEDLKEELALTPNGVAGLSNLRSLLGRAQVAFAILLAIAALKARTDILLTVGFYHATVFIGRVVSSALDGNDPFSIKATAFIFLCGWQRREKGGGSPCLFEVAAGGLGCKGRA
jgi:hypothetical protein